MNKRLSLAKVLLVIALIVGLVGLVQKPATVQLHAQSGAQGASVVAYVLPPGSQPQVNWNS
jgi:hypothetical protein